MKQKIFALALALVIGLGSVSVAVVPMVHAQTTVPTNTPTGGSGGKVQDGLNKVGNAFPSGTREGFNIENAIITVIEWALYLAGMAAVLFIIYGGFLYITAAGNDGQAKEGRKTLVNALIGLVLVVLSYLIVQVVYRFLIENV